ncbi:AMIN domain-containing protein [Cronbergia sp. UHCC 0137]|uniref:AMIN domain-containing protein n=1 Tax=Cronbergia sp. UHCC 0137 TaxID=3110239 RepID=UPI002B20C18D|nr:AMIN domain-containing protein [Cronbergia sp. UHCC 0137]MEA5616862.1 AMIN domain-containing protein [Cronbergia sp. UHCC 0137]
MKQVLKISCFSSIIALTLANNISFAAPTVQLKRWHFHPKTQKLEITLSATTTPIYFYLPQPSRLVIDLPNTALGSVPTIGKYQGTIQGIRLGQLDPNVTRIVLDLAPGTFVDPQNVQLQPLSSKNPTRWVLSPLISHHSTSSSAKDLSPQIWNTLPPAVTNLPLTTTNTQQPFVIVPPLNSQNSFSPIPVIEFGQPLPQ